MKFVTRKFVRQYLKSKGKQTSEDVYEKLDELVKDVLDGTIEHQEAETKKTVMGRHIKKAFSCLMDYSIKKRRL